MTRSYYSAPISEFLVTPDSVIRDQLAQNNEFTLLQTQREAWQEEIVCLKEALQSLEGKVYLEYSIPRMGKRVDAIVISSSIIFVIEFKIGSREYNAQALDQVWDYALDLQNFHETSHHKRIIPILAISGLQQSRIAPQNQIISSFEPNPDLLHRPSACSLSSLGEILLNLFNLYKNEPIIDIPSWEAGHYKPTPTIVEAATTLYSKHSVESITRSEAGATNLSVTSREIGQIIETSRDLAQKSICFVTGVPGAGKTLVGLDIATKFIDLESDLHSVFLSGNGPLVQVLQEALYQDRKQKMKSGELSPDKKFTRSVVKSFIQNVHHFRDAALVDAAPPHDHVAIFDEAQRAWNLDKTADFMSRKKNRPDFSMSEPEFLISYLDRHQDWAVIVCLVGGGQEIHTGEAGIGEWLRALQNSYPDWHIYISDHLADSEYNAEEILASWEQPDMVELRNNLHLSVSLRSFRAERVSSFVKHLLDLEPLEANGELQRFQEKYPVVLTRELSKAKRWLKTQARGSERYGIVVSSKAERLKPHAIDVKTPVDPVHWFLKGKDDVRSSYYLEDVATEFQIQGLELDWTCVVCDGDFRYNQNSWEHWEFKGSRWNQVRKEDRQLYQKNAYRVLLTRARQGLVIVVPEGDAEDPTRKPEYYDPMYNYLKSIGMEELE
ncbi:MAG: hypothetical protein CVU49_05125 [Candidatus Cloacimonetes bacterium HGW-Cloacimonetes-2]|jgi:hypothetical protein|nr:MAG: hypothetical protein CVU49_05125 [Candidatus Cloacimonetes bacterium HGW-Cloacimonetes-2]